MKKVKNIRAPNKDIKIEPHELMVMNTPTFQRLFSIKQLGLAYLVYPFAAHPRASHCLDCLDMAQRLYDALVSNGQLNPETTSHVRKVIRLSALLHDIMHIPFGHTFEDENYLFVRGDKGQRIDRMLSKLEKEVDQSDERAFQEITGLLGDVKKVLWALAGESGRLENEKYFIADIVGNTICADLLSYILRDVEFTGIEKRPGGWYRLFDYFELHNDGDGRKRLCIRLTKAGFRHDVISAIIGILDVRYSLTEQVIYHHAKCAASAMLGKICYLCKIEEEELYSIGDERLFALLNEKADKLPERTEDGRPLRGSVKELILNLEARCLYKRIYKVTFQSRKNYDRSHSVGLAEKYMRPEQHAIVEEKIERELDLPVGSVIIFCPSQDMALKEAEVMVIYDKIDDVSPKPETVPVKLNGTEFERDYPEIWRRVKEIQDRYENLWNLYLFLNPDRYDYAAFIQERIKDELNVENDPLLELYLLQKPEYQASKEMTSYLREIEAEKGREFVKGVVEVAARGKRNLAEVMGEVREQVYGDRKGRRRRVKAKEGPLFSLENEGYTPKSE